jgi:hypothetical protein
LVTRDQSYGHNELKASRINPDYCSPIGGVRERERKRAGIRGREKAKAKIGVSS